MIDNDNFQPLPNTVIVEFPPCQTAILHFTKNLRKCTLLCSLLRNKLT